MAYLPTTEITFPNASLDAFARLRTSGVYTIFDSKQVEWSGSLFWDASGSAGATTVWNKNRASTMLNVLANPSSSMVRQTRQRFNYQPGKSQVAITTFVFGSGSAGLVKRTGYFDHQNGVFLQQSGSQVHLGLRSYVGGSATDTLISQSAWNIDKLDGSGTSQVTLDLTKAQIFFTDFEWLGVGKVRYGFYYDGLPVYCHELTHQNELTSVYMSNPNLPIRYEIYNVDGTTTGSLEAICSSVQSEGGFDPNGIVYSVDTGIGFTPLAVNTGVYRPLLAVRLKSGSLSSTVNIQTITVVNTSVAGGGVGRMTLLHNPTIGGGNLSFTALNSGSAIEYAVGTTSLTIAAEGTRLFTDLFSSQQRAGSEVLRTTYTLGASISGSADVIVLAVESYVANSDYIGAINVRELT